MIWQPYDQALVDSLPYICRDGFDIWLAQTWITSFECVARYVPDRVMRQFGLLQHIPNNMPTVQIRKAQGRPEVNWSHEHRHYITDWENRRNHIQTQREDLSNDPEETTRTYMVWYWNITRRWMISRLTPPDISYRPHGRVERRLVKFSFVNIFCT